METLYVSELSECVSIVYLVKSPMPSISYKIKIDISKSANNNTKIFVLKDLRWSLLMEDSYKEIGSNSLHANHLQANHQQRQQKINEIFSNVYKLLCQ